MSVRSFILASSVLAILLLSTNCSGPGAKSARDSFLAVKDLTCIFGSAVIDAGALAKICGISDGLLPIVDSLIGQREGARKAGVAWRGLADSAGDAGAPEAGR